MKSNAEAIEEVQGKVADLETNKESPDQVISFWKGIAFHSTNLTTLPAASPVYVTFCNEPPAWQKIDDDPRGFRSGAGEVVASFELSRTLAKLGLSADLLRSRKLSPDVLAGPNLVLIVLGSTLAFKNLRSIRDEIWPGRQRFEFGWQSRGDAEEMDGFIFDRSKNKRYLNVGMSGDRPEYQYAVISVIWNTRKQRLVNLAGISTLGTEAAVRFLCRPETVEDICKNLPASSRPLSSFEALIEIPIHHDVPYLPTLIDFELYEEESGAVSAATA